MSNEEAEREIWDEIARNDRPRDTLGPCGCRDYHYADCPTRSGASMDPPEPDDDYDPERYQDDEDDEDEPFQNLEGEPEFNGAFG